MRWGKDILTETLRWEGGGTLRFEDPEKGHEREERLAQEKWWVRQAGWLLWALKPHQGLGSIHQRFSCTHSSLLPLICEPSISSVKILGLLTNLQETPIKVLQILFFSSPFARAFH